MATVEAVALEHASVIHALGETGTAVFPADDHYAVFWRVAATGNRSSISRCTGDASKAAVTGTLEGTTVHMQHAARRARRRAERARRTQRAQCAGGDRGRACRGRLARCDQARPRSIPAGEGPSAGEARDARRARGRDRHRRHLQLESRFDARRHRRARIAGRRRACS